MRGIREDDPVGQQRALWAFHELVWAASHSNTLVDLLSRLQANLRRYPDGTLSQPGRWKQALTDMERLVSAIREHRTSDAGDIAGAHLSASRELQLRAYADQGQLDPVR